MFAQIIPLKRGPTHLPFFDYSVPPDLEKTIMAGQLVAIPLRSASEYGIVRALVEQTESNQTKPIADIICESPLLSAGQISFLEEASQLYHVSLGFLLKNNLPKFGKRKIKQLTKSALPVFNDEKHKFTKPSVFIYLDEDAKKKYLNEICALDGQTLILVPETSDVDAILALLEPEHAATSVVITSRLGAKQFFDDTLAVRSGEKKIIIGTHRATFLPFFNLRRIIVDDEGNPNNKSWDMAPRIHNRDVALLLAKHHNADLYISTHTPTVETYYLAEKKIYGSSTPLLPLLRQNYSVISMKDERRGGNYSIISEELGNALKKTTGSVFLFLNRRGTMNYLACRDCGEVLRCPKCKRSLAYHRDSAILDCHYCDYKQPMIATCAKCHGTNLAMYGAGTEAVEGEIKKLLPADPRQIIRIEQDEKSLKFLDDTKNQIIIGTQLAWRRLNWKKLELMAFIDADTPLFIPEFRSVENTWQQLRDAIYRLPTENQIFIQTNHPDHIIFSALAQPETFYRHELMQRKMFGYPPYRYILKMFIGHPSERVVQQEASLAHRLLAELTKDNLDIKITTNLEMFPAFAKGKYWQVILAKLDYKNYKQSIKLLLSKLPNNWKVDPNPNTILSL